MADDAKKGGLISGWFKAVMGAALGLLSGAAAVWGTAIVDKVAKPNKPVANFAVTTEGLTVTCQNRASGDSGWWDFGDGTPLEPFDANQQSVQHQYAKPGNYSVKLIVRNFIMEENERSVPVDLTTPPQTLPPSITGLQIEPIGSRAVAPATFRIRGEVKNAERMIWDLGDSRLEVTTDSGPFERLVVFERPGQYPISLIGHAGKQAVKQGAMVSVSAPSVGNISVVMSIQDVATRVDRQTILESVPMPPPPKGSKTVERIVNARPGCTIGEVKVGKFNPTTLKNVKTEISADKQSVKLIGEYAVDGDAAVKAAGSLTAIVPLSIVEEKTIQVSYPRSTLSGQISSANGVGQVLMALPPQPRGVTGLTRNISLDVREAGVDGRPVVLSGAQNIKLPYQADFNRATGRMRMTASQVGEQIQVNIAATR